MPGLERLLRNLYGSTPQIDLDQQIARVRVVKPVVFDFPALVDGLKRANVGYGSAAVTMEVDIQPGQAVVRSTGQALPLEGSAQPGRRTFDVLDAKTAPRRRARP
jgi:hypothetical protein